MKAATSKPKRLATIAILLVCFGCSDDSEEPRRADSASSIDESQVEQERLKRDQEKLALDRQKLALEQEKLALEQERLQRELDQFKKGHVTSSATASSSPASSQRPTLSVKKNREIPIERDGVGRTHVSAIVFSPSWNRLAIHYATSPDDTSYKKQIEVAVLSVDTWGRERLYSFGEEYGRGNVAFSGDNLLHVGSSTSSEEKSIKTFDLLSQGVKPIRSLVANPAFAVGNNGEWLAVQLHGSETLSVLDAATGDVEFELPFTKDQEVRALQFSQDAKLLSAHVWFQGTTVWDIPRRERIARIPRPGEYVPSCIRITSTADGKYRLYMPSTHKLELFDAGATLICDVASGSQVGKIERPFGGVTCAAISPDGSLLATGGYGGPTRIFSTNSPDIPLAQLHHSEDAFTSVHDIAWSHDGKQVYLAVSPLRANALIQVWDVVRN